MKNVIWCQIIIINSNVKCPLSKPNKYNKMKIKINDNKYW